MASLGHNELIYSFFSLFEILLWCFWPCDVNLGVKLLQTYLEIILFLINDFTIHIIPRSHQAEGYRGQCSLSVCHVHPSICASVCFKKWYPTSQNIPHIKSMKDCTQPLHKHKSNWILCHYLMVKWSVAEKLSWFIRHLSDGLYTFYSNLWNHSSDIWA